MITFKGELKDIIRTIDNGVILTIGTSANNLPLEELSLLKTAKNGIKIDVSKWREKRSLNANAYLWKLLDEIACKVESSKEELYKHFVRDYGVFEILPIKKLAVNEFIRRWQDKGLGWVCVIDRDSKIPNYVNVFAYFGTSTYNTEEMSRLLNAVVEQAKELGIQTLEDVEMQKLLEIYENDNKRT